MNWKLFSCTFVKLGRFGKDHADLKFQEVEEGNLLALIQSVSEQLNRKFLVKAIEFEGMHRIEKGQYPTAAIREMLLNALIHRNYMGAPFQIRVYDYKISIWNEGFLPEGLTLEALKRSHASRPRNPILADVAFKGGYIDAWGRGTIKIIDSCSAAGLPEPEMIEQDGGFLLTIARGQIEQVTEQVTEQVDQELVKLLSAMKGEMKLTEIMGELKLSHRPHFLKTYLEPALQLELIERTQPDSPSSPTQRYRLTPKGKMTKKDL